MLGFLNLFTAMSLKGLPETTGNNQADSEHYICFKFHPSTFKNMADIQKHPTCDLFRKSLRLDESKLPFSCIDASCLKNMQKQRIIHRIPFCKHCYRSKKQTATHLAKFYRISLLATSTTMLRTSLCRIRGYGERMG